MPRAVGSVEWAFVAAFVPIELLALLNRCYFGEFLICRAVGSVAFGRFGRAWQLSFSLIRSVR